MADERTKTGCRIDDPALAVLLTTGHSWHAVVNGRLVYITPSSNPLYWHYASIDPDIGEAEYSMKAVHRDYLALFIDPYGASGATDWQRGDVPPGDPNPIRTRYSRVAKDQQ